MVVKMSGRVTEEASDGEAVGRSAVEVNYSEAGN